MWRRVPWHRTRSLRFRLTIAYTAFFAVLLVVLGLLFRQTLKTVFHTQISAILDDEIGALMGYLRFEEGTPVWYYDVNDPEEASVVERLRRILVIADSNGKRLETSNAYLFLGPEPEAELKAIGDLDHPVYKLRTNDLGDSFLVRLGVIKDGSTRYVVGVGRTLIESERVLKQFTWNYFALLPLVILSSGLLGWLLSGRALDPMNNLARTAQRVSGSSLALRIPPRGADDEIDNLIQTFNGMMERLERSFQQTRQFSTDVSHELRTPLTTIRGQLEVALFTATNSEQYRDAIVTALQEVERLTQVVRALFQLAQAESGQLELQRIDADLAALVRDLVDQFGIPAEEARLQLTATTPPVCLAYIDRVQIGRLITNLLSNAVKYTPPGGTVEVTLAARPDFVTLRVRDTGRGIDPAYLPHIFDRFYRVPAGGRVRAEKGLGLGLSFVAWIVQAHHGTINVDSAPDAGTTFTVTLPGPRGLSVNAPKSAVETAR